MLEHNIVLPFSKFNTEMAIWQVAPKGTVVLNNFEPYPNIYSPRKFKLMSGENAEIKITPIIIELQFIEEIKNYTPHFLGHKLDIQKTKLTVVALPLDKQEEKMKIGFELSFLGSGNDNEDKSSGEPTPVIPHAEKLRSSIRQNHFKIYNAKQFKKEEG